ncbi:alpha/beta fold hydrolase [Ferruginibacter albus]|uniref:alpha/beta fold hydrolase n=1 Tax=Ferruginibacter albus TaxID=2875540 RepID=UPI001CC34C6C|nr:alpha/beta hydrolase [Ferruginibacter albus]UAY51745.1 alpha/beta hydrolase [Ferruginibacter albus]
MKKIILFKEKAVAYEISGQGLPVVLIHGFPETGELWHYQKDFLAQQCQVIIPDLPGSGASPYNDQLSTIDDYAEAIKAITDNEKLDRVVLIGHSMGGYISLAFAEKYPQLIKGIGLFHSTALADTEEKKQARLKGIEFITNNGAFPFVKTSVPNSFSADFKDQHAHEVEALIEAGKKFQPEALIQYYRAMIARPDRTSVLKACNVPVLFVIGEQDTIIPMQTVLPQTYLPSLSHIHILQNSAHMGMWEETHKANQILLDFLESLS